MQIHILVIEDQSKMSRILKMELEHEGYQVTVKNNGRTGLKTALQVKPDLILLDMILPELSGIEVLRRLRNENRNTPVIIVTARNTIMDKVEGFNHGANDYVTKPFEIEELLARVRACLRRHLQSKDETSVLKAEDLVIDTEARIVSRHGKTILLTQKEYRLLVYLVMNKNKVVKRDNILLNVWGGDYEGGMNIIDVTLTHLRKKINEGFTSPLVTTVRGFGYTIKEESR